VPELVLEPELDDDEYDRDEVDEYELEMEPERSRSDEYRSCMYPANEDEDDASELGNGMMLTSLCFFFAAIDLWLFLVRMGSFDGMAIGRALTMGVTSSGSLKTMNSSLCTASLATSTSTSILGKGLSTPTHICTGASPTASLRACACV
jgi:hypothetical protein